MKIVSLDGYLVNPGDLSWAPFEALGEFVAYDRTPKEEQMARLQDADAVLMNRSRLVPEIWAACPKLKYLGMLSTGYNQVDLEACKRHGVAVTNVPNYGEQAVAQFALGLLFDLANQTSRHLQSVKNDCMSDVDAHWGDWVRPMMALPGRTLGIIGLGRIGMALAEMACGIGMNVIAYARTEREEGRRLVTYMSIRDVLAKSDAVSLHLPLTPDTRHLINADALALMKPHAFLINTARGGLIDEAALLQALDAGHLGGVALDVIAHEPARADNPLLHYDRVRVTPHIAWGYRSARQRMLDTALQNLQSYLQGGMLNRIV